MKYIARIITLALFTVLLAACDSKPQPPLVFGAKVWPGVEPVFLAQELGYFSGANLRVAEYGNSAEVIQAFRDQRVQAAAMTLGEAMLLRRDIPELKIVLLFDASRGADVILAQPGITDLRQLQGRRVGVENTAMGAYFLSLALKSAGMQARQLELVPLAESEQEAAFRARKVDAVVTFEPVRTRLLAAGAQALFDSSRVPEKLFDVLVIRDEHIGQYHREMTGLVQGWRRALGYLKTEPGKAMQSMARHEKMDVDQFGQAMQGFELLGWQRNNELLAGNTAFGTSMDEVQRYMLNSGLLQVGADAATLVDAALLSEDKQ